MDNATRLQYLEAMGIDVWVPRHLPPVAVPQATDEQCENVGWAEQSEAHRTHHDDFAKQETNTGHRENEHFEAAELGGAVHSAIAEIHDVPNAANVAVVDGMPPASLQSSVQPPHQHIADHIWKDLQNEVAGCRACSLCETRTQTVFGVGNKHADWLLIGEAPGQNEDLQGEPFVGKAGQLLNEMLRAIGLQRGQVYIANMLKCRPPNNRDPQSEEVMACHDFLHRQIELIQPKIILAVGRIAAQNLLKTQQPLSRLRGTRHQLEGIPLVVVHHPAYLLRSLTEKAKAWDDLQFALSVYQSLEH